MSFKWTNIEQARQDDSVRTERLKLWREGGRKKFEETCNYQKPSHNDPDAFKTYLEGKSSDYKKGFITGMLFIKDIHSRPKQKCKTCLDTGWVREVTGMFSLNRDEAKESYDKGEAGSPDGFHCYSEARKCEECADGL